MSRDQIVERRIDSRVWLEPAQCKAPVHEALWYGDLFGWQWPEQTVQIYGQMAGRETKQTE